MTFKQQRLNHLRILQQAGLITGLKIDPVFSLSPAIQSLRGNEAVAGRHYKADFAYLQGGKRIVEEICLKPTLRSKLAAYRYPEVMFTSIVGTKGQ